MLSKKRPTRKRGFAEPKTKYAAPRLRENAHSRRRLPEPETLPDGTVRHFLTMGHKGRVLLPLDMRSALGLNEGDVITAWLKDGEVRMHSYWHGVRKIQQESRRLVGAESVVDELIADRRAAAKRGE